MYHIIIVGADPAGSSTAYHCARQGWKTLLLDQRNTIGTPKQCAEGINKAILKDLNLELNPEWISQEIRSLVLSNFQHHLKLKGRRTQGYILDRKRFDPGLMDRAQAAGAEVRLGCQVISLIPSGVLLSSRETIPGKIIVGADGPQTIIGKTSGLGQPRCGLGLQYELSTTNTEFPNSLQCYLDKDLEPEGYLWVFPKKETLNVGLGSMHPKNLKPALDSFLKRLNLHQFPIKEINAGLIPLHGPLETFCSPRILLVGDAAGHTNPLSGGGLPVALFDGQLAAQIITSHFRQATPLTDYQIHWWQSEFGQATKICLKAKKLLLEFLIKDKLNLILNQAGTREITKVKTLLKLAFKIPLIDSLKLTFMFRSFLKAYKYAW